MARKQKAKNSNGLLVGIIAVCQIAFIVAGFIFGIKNILLGNFLSITLGLVTCYGGFSLCRSLFVMGQVYKRNTKQAKLSETEKLIKELNKQGVDNNELVEKK